MLKWCWPCTCEELLPYESCSRGQALYLPITIQQYALFWLNLTLNYMHDNQFHLNFRNFQFLAVISFSLFFFFFFLKNDEFKYRKFLLKLKANRTVNRFSPFWRNIGLRKCHYREPHASKIWVLFHCFNFLYGTVMVKKKKKTNTLLMSALNFDNL